MINRREIALEPRAVTTVYASIAIVLILMSLVGQVAVHVAGVEPNEIVRMFDLSREHNVPTFFTVMLLLTASLLLGVIAMNTVVERGRDVAQWMLLSAGFLAMAYDEGFQVHERFIEPTKALLGGGDLGALTYAWVLPGGVLVLVIGLLLMGFLRRLPSDSRTRFLVAAGLYLGGAFGIELVGSSYDAAHGYDNLNYNLISTLEESMEMAGLIAFVHALLTHVTEHAGGIELRIGARRKKVLT